MFKWFLDHVNTVNTVKNVIKLGKDDAVLVVRVSVEGNNRTQSLVSKDSIISRVSSGRTNMDNMGILCKWQHYI